LAPPSPIIFTSQTAFKKTSHTRERFRIREKIVGR